MQRVAWCPVGPTLPQDPTPESAQGPPTPPQECPPTYCPTQGTGRWERVSPSGTHPGLCFQTNFRRETKRRARPCPPGRAMGLHKAQHLWQGVEGVDGHASGWGGCHSA